MINSRKRHIQNGCSSRSTAFNFPPSFYAYGIRISKGKRWKLLETSSRGRSNYKDGLKPRWSRVSMTVPWDLLKLLVSKTRALHLSCMEREREQALFLDNGHSQFGSRVDKRSKRCWKIDSPFLDIIFAGFCNFSWAKSTRS